MPLNTVQTLKTLTQPSLSPTLQLDEIPALEFTGATNAWYKTSRHGRTSSIYVVEVKKQTVYYKDRIDDKHTSSMPLARFLKFYRQTGGGA